MKIPTATILAVVCFSIQIAGAVCLAMHDHTFLAFLLIVCCDVEIHTGEKKAK